MMLHWNRLRICLLTFALFGMSVVAAPVVHAATLLVVNNDDPGEGFNDPTAAAPVGGNTGTTVGEQRLIAFQHAADIWGALLSSAVTIRVGAEFNPLDCDATSAVLGSAGPANGFRDFIGAPVTSTWYPVALANALNGSDIDPGFDDIDAQFSSTIGTAGCLTTSGWYYGLDGSPTGLNIDFVSVLVHELGHGLGFLTFVDLITGAKALGYNDTFMLNLEDHGAFPSDYPGMTDAQRVAASTDTGNLHWVGANVRAASGVLTAGKVGDHVRMYAPNPQEEGSSVSHWDTALTPNQIMEPYYTGALHNPDLELPLFQDIGWTLLSAGTLPSAPTIGTATAGNTSISVAFTPGALGTGTLVNYTAACDSSNGGASNSATGTSSPITVSALTNGKLYTCRVKTTSSVGTGPWSANSNSVTPGPPPAAPTNVTITPGPGSATVTFTAPPDNGNPITSYTVTCTAAGQATVTATGTASPITVHGLIGNVTYSCTVAATNGAGTGTASAAVPVTPSVNTGIIPLLMLLLD